MDETKREVYKEGKVAGSTWSDGTEKRGSPGCAE